MVWVRLDDQFHANPKVLSVGLAGAGMYARALAYCGCYLTDGFVPETWAWMQITQSEEPRVLEDLVDAKLWKRVRGGYKIVDYLDFNPSKADVEAERGSARERMRELRENRKRSSDSVRPNKRRSSSSPSPSRKEKPKGLTEARPESNGHREIEWPELRSVEA